MTGFPAPLVVTRPSLQSKTLIAALEQDGHQVVALPLIELVPDSGMLTTELPALPGYDLVVFASPAAVKIWCEACLMYFSGTEWMRGLSFAVAGRASREMLARYGIVTEQHQIFCPADDASAGGDALGELLAAVAPWKRILYLRGDTGRACLPDLLASLTPELKIVPAYRRELLEATTQVLQQIRFLTQSQSLWLISSSGALEHFAKLLDQAVDLDEWRRTVRIGALHVRIAERAYALGFEQEVCLGSLALENAGNHSDVEGWRALLTRVRVTGRAPAG